MRSRRSVHATAVAIIAVGVLVVGAAPAAAGGNHGKLRVVATDFSQEFIDVGPPGPSIGDYFVFFETLESRGREVGFGGGQCVIVEGSPPYAVTTNHCVATLSLRRGQITLQGLVEFQGEDDMNPFTVAITGGTGAYRGAGGQARVIPRGDRIVYKLKFDSKDKGKKKGKKKKGRGRH